VVVRNLTQGTVVCRQAGRADGFGSRALGLMFRRDWRGFDGLILSPCGSIHTWFMRMPIDVCFLDERWRVLRVAAVLRPWRFRLGARGTWGTLEIPAGALARSRTGAGDRLACEPLEQPERVGHPAGATKSEF